MMKRKKKPAGRHREVTIVRVPKHQAERSTMKTTTRRRKVTTMALNFQKGIIAKAKAREALVEMTRLVLSYSDEKDAELACYKVLAETIEDTTGHQPQTVTAAFPRLSVAVQGGSDKYQKYIGHHVPSSFDEPPARLGRGWVLVHNHVRTHRTPSTRGFRAWWQRKDDSVEPCPCGWYDDRGTHYRMAAIARRMGLGTEE
jgi:hypothetical protein